jgi:hypothetical protein
MGPAIGYSQQPLPGIRIMRDYERGPEWNHPRTLRRLSGCECVEAGRVVVVGAEVLDADGRGFTGPDLCEAWYRLIALDTRRAWADNGSWER